MEAETVLEYGSRTPNCVSALCQDEHDGGLISLLRNLPVVNGDSDWRCRTWVGTALAEIANDGKRVGTSELDWSKIEAFSRQYIVQKKRPQEASR